MINEFQFEYVYNFMHSKKYKIYKKKKNLNRKI